MSAAVWRSSPPVAVLTITGAGVPIRVATRRVVATDREGKVMQFAGALDEPTVEQRVGLDGASGGARSVTLRCVPAVDVAEQVARAGGWGDVSGELALWSEAEPWEARTVLLRGRITPASWGPRGAALEVELSEPAWEDVALWPPADAVVTRRTWPDAPEAALGVRYPWPFGLPGNFFDDDGGAASYPATPAVVVDEANLLLLVSGEAVVTATVIIYNQTALDSGTFSVSMVYDGLGRQVAQVDVSSKSGSGWTAADTYFVRDWGDGAIQAPDSAGALRGLGDLLLYLWRRSALRVDLAAWRALRDVLNRVEIAGYLDDPTPPADLIRDQLLPLAPDLALSPGARGVRPIWWRPLGEASARAITVGATYAREQTQPTRADRSGITDIEVAFGYDLAADEYRGAVGVSSQRWDGSSRGPTSHARSAVARERREQAQRIEARWLWSRDAAHGVARTLSRMAWAAPEQDVLSAPLWTWSLWREGDVVEVTETETAQDARRWWVSGVGLAAGRVVLSLERVEDPVGTVRR